MRKIKSYTLNIVWDDGKEESCLVTEPTYLKWVAEGNTPLPADEVTQ